MSTFDDFMIGEASAKNQEIYKLRNELASLRSRLAEVEKERDEWRQMVEQFIHASLSSSVQS